MPRLPVSNDGDEPMGDAPTVAHQPKTDLTTDSATVFKTSLKRAFEVQQQQLEKIFQDELDKRLPMLSASDTASSPSNQSYASTLLSKLVRPSEHRISPKDTHTIETILACNSEQRWEIKSLQSSLSKVETECTSLKAEKSHSLSQLQNVIASLQNDCASLKADHDETRRELSQERQKTAQLEIKTTSLRSMLLPTNDTQISDVEVVFKFTNLRSQILKHVKTAWSREIKQEFPATEMHARILGPFYNSGTSISRRYLDDRLRGVVFSILAEQVFDVLHYDLGDVDNRLSVALAAAESYMLKKLPEDSHASILDWRLAAMKVTAPLRDDSHKLVCKAYAAIVEFADIFQPLSDNSVVEGGKLLEKICQDAVALSLLMRMAKDDYRVDMLSRAIGKHVGEFNGMAEDDVQYPAVSKSEKPDTIAYIMSGALIKLPYSNAADVKVLQKAEAAAFMLPRKKA